MFARTRTASRAWLRRRIGEVLHGYLDEREQQDRDAHKARHDEVMGWLTAFERRQRRDVYTAMERAAANDSAEFAIEAFRSARSFFQPHETLRHAVEHSPATGLALEFGVYAGRTLEVIAGCRGERKVFGFDSFDGLPEHWRWGFDEGIFAAAEPPVVEGATVIAGLFQDVLPDFLAAHPEQLSIAHIDSDLHSSATYVLAQLRSRMVEGTVIIFDEYYNYPGWREHEHRAWQEFVATTGLEFEYLGTTADDEQVSVRITSPPKPGT